MRASTRRPTVRRTWTSLQALRCPGCRGYARRRTRGYLPQPGAASIAESVRVFGGEGPHRQSQIFDAAAAETLGRAEADVGQTVVQVAEGQEEPADSTARGSRGESAEKRGFHGACASNLAPSRPPPVKRSMARKSSTCTTRSAPRQQTGRPPRGAGFPDGSCRRAGSSSTIRRGRPRRRLHGRSDRPFVTP